MFIGKVSTTGAKVLSGVAVGVAAAGVVYLVDPDLFGAGDDVATERQYDFDYYDQDGSGAIETDEMKIPEESAVEWLTNRNGLLQWWHLLTKTMEEVEEQAQQEFDRLDINHDDMLHIDECSEHWILGADWRASDFNGDGQMNMGGPLLGLAEGPDLGLTAEEDAEALTVAKMEQMWQENHSESGDFNPSWFHAFNRGGDDTLGQQEFASFGVQAWDALDANQDGKATLSEQILDNRRWHCLGGQDAEDTTSAGIEHARMLGDHWYSAVTVETA